MKEDEVYKIAGEEPPFLMGTKACFEKLGRAIIEHDLKVTLSIAFSPFQSLRGEDPLTRNDSFVVSLVIPASKLEQVEKDLGCTLTDHFDIQIGSEIISSPKWKDINGISYTSCYPGKNEN